MQSLIPLLVAIPSLIIAIVAVLNGFATRKEVKGKAEETWMTLTKESTELVLGRIEELKEENKDLRGESQKCRSDMKKLKLWLVRQGIEVPEDD